MSTTTGVAAGACVEAPGSAVVEATEASTLDGPSIGGQDATPEQIATEGAESSVMGVKAVGGGEEGGHAASS